jgi:carbon monoxide dehydrogenase subunit G
LGGIEKSIVIKAPPKKVWEMLAFDRLPEWGEGFGEGLGERVEYTSEVNIPKDKYRVGATAQGTPNTPFGDTQHHICRFEIIESLENKKIKYYAWEKPKYFGTLGMFISYSLEPAGTDTKITYEHESEKYGIFGILGKFLEKLYLPRWAKKNVQKALENLKSILEK